MASMPWGEGGSQSDPRYMRESKSRRRCSCGCGQRQTHVGMANGVALMSGCELSVRRWVRNPVDSHRRNRDRLILNDHERAALWIIALFVDRLNVNPSLHELRMGVALRSSGGAARVLNNLVNKGAIDRAASKDELLRITDAGRAALTPETK